MSGWGACCNGVRTRVSGTLVETARHITELELLGALYAVQTFAVKARAITIQMFLDSI
jgi:hypothetical protein